MHFYQPECGSDSGWTLKYRENLLITLCLVLLTSLAGAQDSAGRRAADITAGHDERSVSTVADAPATRPPVRPVDTAQAAADVDLKPDAVLRSSGVTVIVPLPSGDTDSTGAMLTQLQLSSAQILAMRAQVKEDRKKAQPLIDELAKIERQLMAVTISERFDEQKVRHLAAKESRIVEKLIIANVELEQKLYWMMTSDQRRVIDEMRAQAAIASMP